MDIYLLIHSDKMLRQTYERNTDWRMGNWHRLLLPLFSFDNLAANSEHTHMRNHKTETHNIKSNDSMQISGFDKQCILIKYSTCAVHSAALSHYWLKLVRWLFFPFLSLSFLLFLLDVFNHFISFHDNHQSKAPF